VKKEFQGKTFHELSHAPIHALNGVATWSDDVAEKLKIRTVDELGRWRFYLRAKAMVALASEEIEGHRIEGSKLNANKCLDKKFEGKSLHSILELPPSAMAGLAEKADELLGGFHIHTIKELGTWKIAGIANAISTMANMETSDLNKHK